MNTLFVAAFASLAAFAVASPSGILGGVGLGLGGTVLAAPTAGAVISGPVGLGLGGAVLAAPSAGAVISGPLGLGLGGGLLAGPLAVAGPLGVGAVTAGGGAIAASAAGAAVRGPPTAPVVISGPSGKIAADGLWGPTANIGLGALGGVGKAW